MVLGEVEARLREPARAGHLVAVDQHCGALARGEHAAEIPRVGPELFRPLDRPAVEIRVAVHLEAALSHDLARELRELRLLDGALARLPKYPRRIRRHAGVSGLQLSPADFAQHYMAHG